MHNMLQLLSSIFAQKDNGTEIGNGYGIWRDWPVVVTNILELAVIFCERKDTYSKVIGRFSFRIFAPDQAVVIYHLKRL
ncbi:unnamed protein product [Cercopithifilaria johnstoni]|uniref:Uncharacterized protein n=1 Tax=Cercopithifilaria johnstoni TaxID=2874296 RepID=A0A8J2M3J5_9BILA|nr:unnamed protein product [Cercopithifilaria johnstoni]